MMYLVKTFLAHLTSKPEIKNSAIKEAFSLSPKQMIYHIGILQKIGADLKEIQTDEISKIATSEESDLEKRYEECFSRAKEFYKQQKNLKAAEEFLKVAPQSITDINEIIDTTFEPQILPTCPAQFYDYKEIFIAGVNAFRRKSYDEAVSRFDELHKKTDSSYLAAVNLNQWHDY